MQFESVELIILYTNFLQSIDVRFFIFAIKAGSGIVDIPIAPLKLRSNLNTVDKVVKKVFHPTDKSIQIVICNRQLYMFK